MSGKSKSIYLILLLCFQLSCAQTPLSREQAIDIALKNGLKTGLDEPEARLIDNKTWEIKSLLCDDNGENYDVRNVDAYSGKTEHAVMISSSAEIGFQQERTAVISDVSFDSIPFKTFNNPYKLTASNAGTETRPSFSPNSKWIAFEYGEQCIAVTDLQGQQFRKICDHCYSARWMGNENLLYFRQYNQLCRQDVSTGHEIQITQPGQLSSGGVVSPDLRWIAYTSEEIWQQPEKDSLGRTVMHAFIEGEGQELCMISTDGRTKKFITKTGRYVHTPCWSAGSDSLFFYVDHDKYFTSGWEEDTIRYARLNRLNGISLDDYKKVVQGVFPYQLFCEIFAVDVKTLTPKYKLIGEAGRYNHLTFSGDLQYLAYTKKDCRACEEKIWLLKLE